jgi:intracellular sulfur oxidation DsrE/DsrF family protein
MSDSRIPSSTPRRSFIGRITLGAAALVAGRGMTLRADDGVRPGSPDEWVSRIHGKYRQVFDAVATNEGMGAAYALNFLDSTKQAHGLKDDDLSAVLSLRHFAAALALNDAAWAKYHVGELINVTDPDTKSPATRNIFRTSIRMRPGLTYEDMIAKRGVIVTACSMALGAMAGMAAGKMGLDTAATQAEWRASLIPGAVIVPSGVYAVNRAQQAGCTYCFAG